MRGRSVIAVMIVVLLCFCPSFGSGERPSASSARHILRRCYGQLSSCLKGQDFQRSRNTIFKHVKEVEDKMGEYQTWIQKISGYSHEQLSNSPESFMDENELALATEYHLLKTGWYQVRSITLNKAAEGGGQINEKYPNAYKCRLLALEADRRSRDHKKKYAMCYEALTQAARWDLMKEIEFPSYIPSQELENPKYQSSVLYEGHIRENGMTDAISNVKMHLHTLINRLLKRKKIIISNFVKQKSDISYLLSPHRTKSSDDMMSNLRNCFAVESFSQPPDQGSRRDRHFLEVAWLFNQYRSLWHEVRYNQFSNYLPHWEPRKTRISIIRLKGAMEFEHERFKLYKELSEGYYEILKKYHPDRKVISPNIAPEADFMEGCRQIHISENEGREPKQWGRKRKRATLKRVRRIISHGTLERAGHQSSDEDLQSLKNEPEALEIVPTEVNDQSDKGGVRKATRYKCLEEIYIDTGIQQVQQCKSSDGISEDLHHPFLENCELDCLVRYNDGAFQASIKPVVHCQPDCPLQNGQKLIETDAINVQEQEESGLSEFDNWLKRYLLTPDSSATHELTALGQAEFLEAYNQHGTLATMTETKF